MTAPETTVAATPTAVRAFSSHEPKWQRFQCNLIIPSTQVGPAVQNKDKQQQLFPYQRQYSHVYHQRLALLGPRCWERIAQQVSNDAKLTKVKRVLELREGQPSLVVGTLVMETTNDDKDPYLHPESTRKESDALYLEDESGRVALEFSSGLFSHQFCTGVVLGVQGTVRADGVMLVQAVFPPAAPPLTSLNDGDNSNEGSTNKAPHLLLLSGLDCGGAETSSLPRDLVISFLQGRFDVEQAACVSHVVIAGGLIRPPEKSNDYTSGAAALRDLDAFLLQLAAARIPVDVIPGQDDPTTANWPQRPLHSALLPRSMRYGDRLVARTPNPYSAMHKNQLIIGTDGANVRDLKKRLLQPKPSDDDKMDIGEEEAKEPSCKPVSDLEALRQTLEWSHVCPTGPDSVPTVPHAESDPMVLTQWPNVYFSGSAHKFATTMVHRHGSTTDVCRVICLPKFATTGQAVLVNLETLDVELLRFQD